MSLARRKKSRGGRKRTGTDKVGAARHRWKQTHEPVQDAMLFGLVQVMLQFGFVAWSHVSTSAQKYWSVGERREAAEVRGSVCERTPK